MRSLSGHAKNNDIVVCTSHESAEYDSVHTRGYVEGPAAR